MKSYVKEPRIRHIEFLLTSLASIYTLKIMKLVTPLGKCIGGRWTPSWPTRIRASLAWDRWTWTYTTSHRHTCSDIAQYTLKRDTLVLKWRDRNQYAVNISSRSMSYMSAASDSWLLKILLHCVWLQHSRKTCSLITVLLTSDCYHFMPCAVLVRKEEISKK